MSPLIRAIFPIIAFLVIGYIARLTKKFDPKNSGILISWVLNISIPCMIIIDMTSQDMLSEYRQYIEFFGGYLMTSFILFCLAYAYGRFIKRKDLLIGSYFAGASVFSNTCMIALPVLAILLPVSGATFGVLGVVVLIIGLQTTSVIYEYCSSKGNGMSLRKVLSSFLHAMKANYFIAMVVGLILSFADVKLAMPIKASLNAVGITTAPVALFAIGAQLNFGLFRHHARIVAECTFFKLFLMPVIAWYVCDLAHLPPAPSVAVVVCAAVSTAKCQYAVARSHDVYVEETEAAVAGTTILSVVTLPVVVSLLTRQFVGVIS